MAWKGADEDAGIYYAVFDGRLWGSQLRIRGIASSDGPALAAVGNRLYLVWKGIEGDAKIYYSWLEDSPDSIWQAQQVAAFTDSAVDGNILVAFGTSHGPAAIDRGDQLAMAWKGIPGDSGIWFASFRDNEWSGQIQIPNVGTSDTPCITVLNGRVYVAWKGANDDARIYYSWLG